MKIDITHIPHQDYIQVTGKHGACLHNSSYWFSEPRSAHMIAEYEGENTVDVQICSFCGAWKSEEEFEWNEA